MPRRPFDQPLVIKLAIGLQHRVCVDRETANDLLDCRQLIAGPQDPQPHGLPHLLHELQVGRNPRTRVQVKLDHRLGPFH